METLTKSCSPTKVITANGEAQTHEEATVYVKELDIFLTMNVLEDTPAVLSLGKLLDADGYSHEWINGQKQHLIKNGIRIQCNTENFVPIVVPGLSTSSSSSLPSSRSMTPSRQEIDHPTYSSSSSTSPTMTSSTVSSEILARQERRDPYSSETSEDLLNKSTKTPKPHTNEDHERERDDPYYSDIPECLQEFRNLVDDRVSQHRHSHASSAHESSLESMPARSADLGKHSIYTHFPKDRNCEIGRGPKSQGLLAEDVLAESYLVQKILVILSICSCGAGLGHPMDPVVSVQNKNFSRNTKELAKNLGAR